MESFPMHGWYKRNGIAAGQAKGERRRQDAKEFQKKKREASFFQQRCSRVVEEQAQASPVQPQPGEKQSKCLTRREKFLKWKAEKERLIQENKTKQRPPFKVGVYHPPPIHSVVEPSAKFSTIKCSTKKKAAAATRAENTIQKNLKVSTSAAALAALSQQVDTVRVTRSRAAATAATKSAAVTRPLVSKPSTSARTVTSQQAAAKSTNSVPLRSSKRIADAQTSKTNQTFAPVNHKFKAPAGCRPISLSSRQKNQVVSTFPGVRPLSPSLSPTPENVLGKSPSKRVSSFQIKPLKASSTMLSVATSNTLKEDKKCVLTPQELHASSSTAGEPLEPILEFVEEFVVPYTTPNKKGKHPAHTSRDKNNVSMTSSLRVLRSGKKTPAKLQQEEHTLCKKTSTKLHEMEHLSNAPTIGESSSSVLIPLGEGVAPTPSSASVTGREKNRHSLRRSISDSPRFSNKKRSLKQQDHAVLPSVGAVSLKDSSQSVEPESNGAQSLLSMLLKQRKPRRYSSGSLNSPMRKVQEKDNASGELPSKLLSEDCSSSSSKHAQPNPQASSSKDASSSVEPSQVHLCTPIQSVNVHMSSLKGSKVVRMLSPKVSKSARRSTPNLSLMNRKPLSSANEKENVASVLNTEEKVQEHTESIKGKVVRRMSIHEPSPSISTPQTLPEGMVPAQFSPYITTGRGKNRHTRGESVEIMMKKKQAGGFRRIVERETSRLHSLCDDWERCLEDAPDTAGGEILVAIGQARLLTKDKFQQFRTLIDKYEKDDSEVIKASDLTGFWEMILVTVEDSNRRFSLLEDLKANSWEEKIIEQKQPADKIKTKAVKPGNKQRVKPVSRIKDLIQAERKKHCSTQSGSSVSRSDNDEVLAMTGKMVQTPVKKLSRQSTISPASATPVQQPATPLSLLQHVLTKSAVRSQKVSSPVRSPRSVDTQMRASMLGRRMSLPDDLSSTPQAMTPIGVHPVKSILKLSAKGINEAAQRNRVAFRPSQSPISTPVISNYTPPVNDIAKTPVPGSAEVGCLSKGRRRSLIPRPIARTPVTSCSFSASADGRPSLLTMNTPESSIKLFQSGDLIDFSTPPGKA